MMLEYDGRMSLDNRRDASPHSPLRLAAQNDMLVNITRGLKSNGYGKKDTSRK